MFCKKGVLRNLTKFTGKHLCQSLFFNKVAGRNFIKKEALVQVFSCEFCEISKNTFSYRTPPVAASGFTRKQIISYFPSILWIIIHVTTKYITIEEKRQDKKQFLDKKCLIQSRIIFE